MTLPEHLVVDAVNTIVSKRVQRIPDTFHPLLYRAAIAGRQPDLRLLRRIMPASFDFDAALSTCSQYAVLEVIENVWRFVHDQIRSALLDMIPADQLPALHFEMAEAIEAEYPDQAQYAAALAHHWRIAGNIEREIHYSELHAQQELTMDNNPRVLEITERILSILDENAPERPIFLYKRGEAQRRLSQFDQARETLNTTITLAKEARNTFIEFKSLHQLGVLAENQGGYEQALVYHEQALELLNRSGMSYPVEQARILDNMGIACQRLGRNEEALSYAEKALALHRAENYDAGIADSLSNIGVVLMMQGKREGAQSMLEESLAIRRRVGYAHGIAVSLNNLGMLMGDLEEKHTSIAYYEEALSICRRLGNQYAVAAILGNLSAAVSNVDDDNERALKYSRESLSVARAIGDKRGIASALNSLSSHERADNPDASLEYAQEALEIAKSIGEQVIIMTSCEQIALAYIVSGRSALAHDALLEGWQIMEEYSLMRRADNWLLHTSVYLRDTGRLRESAALLGFLTNYDETKEDLESEMETLRQHLINAMTPDDYMNAVTEGAALNMEYVLKQTIGWLKAISV